MRTPDHGMEGSMTPDRELSETEVDKETLSYLRHLTTLSTGCVLVLVTFLEKIFPKPLWKCLIIIAVAAFLLSLLSAVFAQVAYLKHMRIRLWEGKDPPPSLRTLVAYSLPCAFVFLFIGVLALGILAIRNV